MVVILIVSAASPSPSSSSSPLGSSPSERRPTVTVSGRARPRPFQVRGEPDSQGRSSCSSHLSSLSSQVEPEAPIATTKEEEWVTKKKVELTTKRQIETRVKRNLLLEDGKVLEDSGPLVTTSTTEDTEKQEHSHTEHHGGDEPDGVKVSAITGVHGHEDIDGKWVSAPGPGGVLREVKERKVKSREEKQELVETEDVRHLGDLSDEGYLDAVRNRQDVRLALLEAVRNGDRRVGIGTGPKIVHQASSGKRVIDTEDKHELSEVQPDGRIVTQTRRTTEHEEVKENEDPDDHPEQEDEVSHRHSSHRFAKTKDQDLVEFIADGVKVGQETRYQCETTEGERFGDPDAMAAADAPVRDWDSLSMRIKRMRKNKQLLQRATQGPGAVTGPTDRKDVLTRRPLDFDHEEETRKVETSKWLEHHFGSESRSSKDSFDDDGPSLGPTTSFINVTMKSRPTTSTPKAVNGFGSASRIFVSSPEPERTKSPSPSPLVPSPPSPRYRDRDRDHTPSYTNRPDRVQVLPTGPNHTFKNTPYNSGLTGTSTTTGFKSRNSPIPVPPPPMSAMGHANATFLERERARLIEETASPPLPPSPPQRRRYTQRIEEDERQPFLHRWDDSGEYRRGSPSPSPSPPPAHIPANKKLYQRTRFAADIPPPSPPPTAPSPAPNHTPRQHSSGLGDSLRRFVGKFRSASREKRRNVGNSSSAPSRLRGQRSRSPSPAPGRRASSRDDSPPTAPRRRERATQTKGGGSGGSDGNADVDRRPGVQKYYLGEDPFGGSIYGREKEYDDVVPARRRHRRRGSQSEEEPTTYRAGTLGRLSKSTSRLTSAPASNGLTTTSSGTTTVRRMDSLGGRGGVQTLPRKLRDDSGSRTRRQVGAGTLTRNHTSTTHTPARASASWEGRFAKAPHTGSLINVSFVNSEPSPPPPPMNTSTLTNTTSLTGPAKPARNYRTTLTRSRSFNVQAVPTTFMSHRDSSKSNSQLHRLDRLEEGPEPLKSPKILASISRSQRDLTDAVDKENVDDLYTKPVKKSQVNGDKRKIFLRGLLDRAPELFRTVHPEEEHRFTERSSPRRNGVTRVIDYSNSMRASPTNGERGPSPAGPRLSHVSSLRRGSAGSGNIRRGSRDSPEEYGDSDTNSRSRYGRGKTSIPSRSRQQSNGSVVIHVRNTRK